MWSHLSFEHIDNEIVTHRQSIWILAVHTYMKQESRQTPWTNVKQQLKAGAYNKGIIWNAENTKRFISVNAF